MARPEARHQVYDSVGQADAGQENRTGQVPARELGGLAQVDEIERGVVPLAWGENGAREISNSKREIRKDPPPLHHISKSQPFLVGFFLGPSNEKPESSQ